MTRLFSKPLCRDLVLGAGVLCAAAALLRWPRECMEAVREGLTLCGSVILPSLFPFFVLSSLLVELGMSHYLGKLLEPVMHPLFRLNGSCACALALGLIGGYPVGARTAVSLYQNGQCSREEAQRLLAFCNNSGPAFLLGVAGAGVFGSSRVGLVLYATHICACVLVGLLFRGRTDERAFSSAAGRSSFHAAAFAPAFTRSVTGALTSALNICAFILCFTVVLRCFSLSGLLSDLSGVLAALFAPFGLTKPLAQALLAGFFEVSTGITSLAVPGTSSVRLSVAAFMLGWAGLSVHCQVLAFSADSGLSMKPYFIGKLLHGLFSALLAPLILGLSGVVLPAAPCLSGPANWPTSQTFPIAAACALTAWLLCFLLLARMLKKSSRNAGRHAL